VEASTVIRKILFGEETEPDEVTSFHFKLLEMYWDWKEFKIFPYNRNAPVEQHIPFYKNMLRCIDSINSEAKTHKNEKRRTRTESQNIPPQQRKARILSSKTTKGDTRIPYKVWKARKLAELGIKPKKIRR
jgi:hypothetical protein